MINTKNSNVIIYMFFLSILNVLMIYLIKYDLNSIPIKNFSLDNLGNLAPLIIEWVFLILLFISLIVEKEFMAINSTIAKWVKKNKGNVNFCGSFVSFNKKGNRKQ